MSYKDYLIRSRLATKNNYALKTIHSKKIPDCKQSIQQKKPQQKIVWGPKKITPRKKPLAYFNNHQLKIINIVKTSWF